MASLGTGSDLRDGNMREMFDAENHPNIVARPVLKEKRYLEFYGESFRAYRRSVPYWVSLRSLTRRGLAP